MSDTSQCGPIAVLPRNGTTEAELISVKSRPRPPRHRRVDRTIEPMWLPLEGNASLTDEEGTSLVHNVIPFQR